MTQISVILCTHNPRKDYLRRVLEALRAQTLPAEQWELIVVDNASERPLVEDWDLSWHPKARHIREEELGLTSARFRGIAEAKGELLVFVDDDNVVDKDYLRAALDVGRDYPFLGAWGGAIRGEFEAEPEPWLQPLLGYLLVREFPSPVWSNNPGDWRAQPCGAGLCVRRCVATAYAKQLGVSPARRRLDRIGSKLSSCGDSDLIQTSCDIGQGFGNFPELRLTHLIPRSRVQPKYLIRLMQGITSSLILLQYLRTGDVPPKPSIPKVLLGYTLTWATQGRRQARIYKASLEATREGVRMARELQDCQTGALPQEPVRIRQTDTSG
jgi:glycosyltransferase involved in cell wall biosynthesis